ncbi:MAG TPA: sigma-54-dependent Fis family transcriptional regulator [Proteobacteria bacterium]|nr:sigma-54-dependent Fis family transcriptional regulator [Pseudomonadota bacterium]
MTRETIIVVDDEAGMLNFISKILKARGYRTITCCNGAEFVEQLGGRRRSPDLALIDYRLPDTTGIELLSKVAELCPELQSIIITAYGEVELAVESMRRGAADFLAKPFTGAELLKAVDRILEPRRLKQENELLRWQLASGDQQPALICRSRIFAQVVALAEQVASSSATVLLTGESGTGKEVVAAHIHNHDPLRRAHRFLAVNCGALADNLLESQLFGALRGAYTGADKDTPGLFRAADQGTLLLDEIAETSPALQRKLLRVLEKKEVTPVGGTVPEPVDVRIIAATNRDLRSEVEAGRFRADLYYRLQVFSIELPPLRQRPADIMPLVHYFLDWYCRQEGKPMLEPVPEIIPLLENYSWPGNVRELRNLVHRAVILARQPVFDASLLPFGRSPVAAAEIPVFMENGVKASASLKEVELDYIAMVYRQSARDRKTSAEILGISEKTLGRKLELIRRRKAN